MSSLECHNSLDTHQGILLTSSCHSCGIAKSNNDMHGIGENRIRPSPLIEGNQNVVPVPSNSTPWKNPGMSFLF